MASILFRMDRRSRPRSSRSRRARRASSSASSGIGTIEQTRGSSRSHAINVRNSISTSMTSVFARRARRSTGRLEGCITWTSTPRRTRKRANQHPSRPASYTYHWARATFIDELSFANLSEVVVDLIGIIPRHGDLFGVGRNAHYPTPPHGQCLQLEKKLPDQIHVARAQAPSRSRGDGDRGRPHAYLQWERFGLEQRCIA